MRRLGLLVVLGALALGACDSPARPGTGSGGRAGTGGSTGGGGAGGGTGCGTDLGIASHPDEGAQHAVVCDASVTYGTNPPSSGRHYSVWPAYKTYTAPVPWGFMVHGLEHGAMMVVYNCPAGCADEVAAAQAWIDALPADAAGTGCAGDRPRIVLAPDPTLTVRWAATAWTWTLRSCTFDEAMFREFFDAHYNHGLETVCRFSNDADYSATGWCP